MKLNILFERAPSEVLDPLFEEEEPGPTGELEDDLGLEMEEPTEEPMGPDLEGGMALGDDSFVNGGPRTDQWTASKSTDGRDETFAKGDLRLRFRPIKSIENRWVAQLTKGDKLLNKGFIDVPSDAEPMEYIQDLADSMLSA